MNKEKVESIEETVLPTLEELGFEPSKKDGGTSEALERTPLADQKTGKVEKEKVVEPEETTVPDEEVIPPTEDEQKAMEQGWIPKDQYKGDPEKWRDAKAFLEYGELTHKISTSNKKIGSMQRAIDDMATLIKGQAKKNDNKEIAELGVGRKAAILDGDVETVEKYDEKIKELETSVAPKQEHPQETLDFVHGNADWFNSEHAGMRAYAIAIDDQLAKSFPQMPLTQRYAKTKEMVVKTFPVYFGVKPQVVNHKSAQPKVESASNQQGIKKKAVTYKDMPEDVQKLIMNVVRASDHKVDKNEYAQELVRIGEVVL